MINPAHIHLVLNHVPVVGTLLALVLLAIAAVRMDASLERAALLLVVISAVLVVPVYLSGEPAEEMVEKLDGVSHTALESHEDQALITLWAVIVAGVVAAAGLAGGRMPLLWKAPPWVLRAAYVGTLVAAVILLTVTANQGGRIRHPEIDMTPATSGTSGDD